MRSGTIIVSLAAMTLVSLSFVLRKSPDHTAGRQPGPQSPLRFTERIDSLIATTGEDEKARTIADLLEGATINFSDAELWLWIRDNQNSESAWLAAFASRYSISGNNPWLAEGLKHHPGSLALTMMAANTDLLAISQSTAASRDWLDRFVELDPDNGLPWMMSALAEYYRGNFELADHHWTRASQASEMRIYTGQFGEAGYELFAATQPSEALSTIMGNASIPVLQMPRLSDVFKEIHFRSELMRETGRDQGYEELANAGFLLGIHLFETEAPFGLMYRIAGMSLYDRFEDAAAADVVLANTAAKGRLEDFRHQLESMRNKWPDMEKLSESQYLWWDSVRQSLGELTAASVFAGR